MRTQTIALDAFLKWAGIVTTGGQAKQMIQRGEIRVNGNVEQRRGRGLRRGDEVAVADGDILVVVHGPRSP